MTPEDTSYQPHSDNIDNIEQMARALTLMDQAVAHDNSREVAQRERELWDAGRIFEEIGDERGAATAMVSLAKLYEQTGRNDEADRAYRQAIEVYRSADLRYQAIEATIDLGRFISHLPDRDDEADTTLHNAVGEARQDKFPDLEGHALLELGKATVERGQAQEGGALLDQAAEVLGAAGDQLGRADCMAELAKLLWNLDRTLDAETALRATVQGYIDADRDDLAAGALDELATFYESTDRSALADKVSEEAGALRRRGTASGTETR